MRLSLLIGFCLLAVVFGRKGFGPTEQEWGYVTVREGAHMFWWLHTTAATPEPTERPLILYLAGGPGRSGSLVTNFEEIGPWDKDQKPRNYTWVNDANILFVDSPVGCGFSYVDNNQFATTDQQVATDLVVLLQAFFKQLPQFEKVPLYIFSESYGGKTAPLLALQLYQANQNGTVKSNLKGIGLGAAWISPIDSILAWAPYFYSLGVLDTQQYKLLDIEAQKHKQLVDTGKWTEAAGKYITSLFWVITQTSASFNIFSNVISKYGPAPEFNVPVDPINLHLMNELVKPALNLSRNWTSVNRDVFNNLSGDFMRPVPDIIERLLNETDITVALHNHELDGFVPNRGTLKWVNKLNYKGSKDWTTATREVFAVDGVYEGYIKKAGNFELYWALRAGHTVARDNPNAQLYILQQVTNNFQV